MQINNVSGVKDLMPVVSNSKVAKLANKVGYPARDVRMDAKTLLSLLIINEDIGREYEYLKNRYSEVGIEELVSTIKMMKQEEEV